MLRHSLLLLISSGLFAGEQGELMKAWDSPSLTLRAEAYFQNNERDRTIYLFEPGKPQERVILCKFNRDAELLFSPDESWIALNDVIGSIVSEIRLFKRIKGLNYSESNIHADALSWKLLERLHKIPRKVDLMHTYARVIKWSSDSSSFLVALSGHTDINLHVDEWVCVFDLRTKRASLSLSLLNRKAVTFRLKRDGLGVSAKEKWHSPTT